MFLNLQTNESVEMYSNLLKAVGALSKLFSDASEPYLASRAAENIFCKAFNAENLSRTDLSADASVDRIGFAIKTFLENNGRSFQKIAEFDSDHNDFRNLSVENKVRRIAELRNDRILTTQRIFGLDQILYHCITRQVGRICIYETILPLINLDQIRGIDSQRGGSIIKFCDNQAEYSFSISKSTLSKRFISENILLDVPVRIITDPYEQLIEFVQNLGPIFTPLRPQPHVYLPLYSSRGDCLHVPEKSGLNQWNASGRPRDPNEIYIPIPAWIHRAFPRFFPSRDIAFNLTLPDRTTLSAKICQENSKALMTNPNADLGRWLLRNVLNIPERELLTYARLQDVGLDSVVIYKIDNETYDIDFTRIGSYEQFKTENENQCNGMIVE